MFADKLRLYPTCPEAWESRHLYAVEATPRPSRLTQALHAKSVVYVDSESWFAPYVDTYSRDGQLFQNVLFWLAYRDRAVPEARVAIYPYKRMFQTALVDEDIQDGFSSVVYMPGQETDEHESWYINMGIVTKAFLDPHQLQNFAH